MQYDDGKRWLLSKQDLFAFNDGMFQRMTHFDFLGRVRLRRSTDAGGTALDTNGEAQGEKVETKYYRSYSDGFNYEATSNPYASTTPAASRGWTRIKRDKLGRVVETGTFDGSTPPSPWGANTTSSGVAKIDYNSEVQVLTDQWQQTRTLVYDALDRLVQVTDGAGTTYYAYDALDNLTYVCQNGTPPASVCSGGQKRTFVYSSLKRLVSATNPESGTTTYTYYDNGLLHTKTDALGKVVTYNYDALNRLTTKSYNDATPAVTYTYDDPAAPYSRGRLTKVSSTVSTTDYVSYDALGRVTASKQTLPALPTYTFGYIYSPFGLMQTTYPSGRAILTTFDGAGRQGAVFQKKNSTSSPALVASAQYAPQGGYSRLDYGSRVCEWIWYNGRMQPYSAGVRRQPSASNMACDDQTPSSSFIAQHGWSYTNAGSSANNGNVTAYSHMLAPWGVSNSMPRTTYSYDSANRLKTVLEADYWSGAQHWRQTFVYDAYGNRALLPQTGPESRVL